MISASYRTTSSPPQWSWYKSLRYCVHLCLISSFDCSNVPFWLCNTLSRGVNFCRSVLIRLYASLVLPAVQPFSACSHGSWIQCSLSCLADLFPLLQEPSYACAYLSETFFICFSHCLSSTSVGVSSEIQCFLVARLAGTVDSTALLIAFEILAE